ncbi:MAG: type 1 glutamine amidotransferase domain-containing protein [Pseudomonadota bacterium]
MRILCILPEEGHDPTESAVIWQALTAAGADVRFATPAGAPGHADRRLTDLGFGLLNPLLMTRPADLECYRAMARSPQFNAPLSYANVVPELFDGLVIPGGHAAGVKTMLESPLAQCICLDFFTADKPVAAVCHGVLLAARSIDPRTGKSVLHGRKTTALPASMELTAWLLTVSWLGDYYRTYLQTVADEVRQALADPADFDPGPLFSRRGTATAKPSGFIVTDGNYLSGRWPGDCHRLARAYVRLLSAHRARNGNLVTV